MIMKNLNRKNARLIILHLQKLFYMYYRKLIIYLIFNDFALAKITLLQNNDCLKKS